MAHLPPFDPGLDHFARLGLKPSVDVDRESLESNYLERSVAAHPDRHQAAGDAAQRLAMEHASALNVAYKTLRAPVGRAEYLVKMGGIDLDSSDVVGGAPKPDQAFLFEMIERREALDEAAAAGEEALEDMRDGLADESGAVLRRAQQALRDGAVADAARELVTHRYLKRLDEEIEARLEGNS